jgi:perosamine synthetase
MKTLLQPFHLSRTAKKSIQKHLPRLKTEHIHPYRIPVSCPDISEKEERYVRLAMESKWISGKGPYVEKFEQLFASQVSHTKYAIAVNSGTSALHLSLLACNIGPGDEVIIPTFTMIATANAVRYTGATPVCVDADLATWNMDVTKIEARITKRTKAIAPVHIYGLPVDMHPIQKLAKKYGLWVIEDAAEAHGAEYRGHRVGGLGDVAAFSFFANKIITTGEGGMITTNNKKIAHVVRTLRGHAFTRDYHFWHQYVGYSYEMTNLAAGVGLGQTERFRTFVAKRKKHAMLYTKLLHGIPGITTPPQLRGYVSANWMYGVLVDSTKYGVNRNDLRMILAKKGIETRPFFVPIHMQPPYQLASVGSYPVSEKLCCDGLYLPSGSTLTDDEITYVATIIRKTQK